MSRIQYEIGARNGTEEAVGAFIRDIKDTHSDYYSGRHNEPTFRSVQRAEWEDFDEFISKLTLWTTEWSVRHPEVEIFSTASEPYGALGVRYTSFRRGELETAETIGSHAHFERLVATCDCSARPGYFEKYPTEAPFVDCPIRLNPPTAWAVENIMYAMENLPVRRTR